MPTPIPAASATGSPKRRQRGPAGQRRDRRCGHEHRGGQAVDAAQLLESRDPVREHDVDREQRRVGEGEADAERLALDPHAGQQIDARHRQRSAAALRAVRAPSAASTITGRNSIAATVPSGSRSIAR